MKDIVVVWATSYGKLLELSNWAANENAVLLDCSLLGKWSQAILDLSSCKDVGFILKNLENNKQIKWQFFKSLEKEIIDSYLSLASNKVEDFLLVVELDFLGDAFSIAENFFQDGLKIVDLRLLRFFEPKVLLLLTGNENKKEKISIAIENILSQKKKNMEINIVSPVSSQIKNLFHLE